MRKMTATICLTLAVLLGSEVSVSAENKSIIEKKIGNTEFYYKIEKDNSGKTSKNIIFSKYDKVIFKKSIDPINNIDAQKRDINGDGIEELLVRIHDGGNCCAPDLFLYFIDIEESVVKEYFFEKWQAWNGWDDVIITNHTNAAILKSTDHNVGMNPDLKRSDISYEFDGKEVRLSTIKKYAEIPALVELRSTDFDMGLGNVNQKKVLKFDLNSDGEDEELICGIWVRWGSLIECSVYSSFFGSVPILNEENISLGKRIGVLGEKRNGWHILVVDFDERWVFDPKLNRYQKENNL